MTLAPEWGNGEQIYLYFAVKDTGRGLDEEEKTRLFHRFSQASPRTHVELPFAPTVLENSNGKIGTIRWLGSGALYIT